LVEDVIFEVLGVKLQATESTCLCEFRTYAVCGVTKTEMAMYYYGRIHKRLLFVCLQTSRTFARLFFAVLFFSSFILGSGGIPVPPLGYHIGIEANLSMSVSHGKTQ